MASNLSVPLAFVALLHLANEKVSPEITPEPLIRPVSTHDKTSSVPSAIKSADFSGVKPTGPGIGRSRKENKSNYKP